MKKITLAIIVILGVCLIVCFGMIKTNRLAETEEYNPQINPTEFSTDITNKYFNLPVGKQFIYQSQTKDGKERIEVLVTDQKKMIMGVETIVYWDRVYLEGQLIEDTRDYLAQHANGDVWYFGEDVDNYENGKLKDHHGAWIAGINGALPGIWMKANPQVGDSYRQEYYRGEAEDRADVLAVNEVVEINGKRYTDCVKTYDYSPIIPDLKENKYYCPEIGGPTLEVDQISGERTEIVDLISGVETPNNFKQSYGF